MVQMQKGQVVKQVQDFIVLPLRLPSLPSFPRETTHYLYLRANAPRLPTRDTPREIFLANVPIDATETHFRALFADQLGGARVEDVEFENVRVAKGIKAPVIHSGKKRKRGADNGDDAEVEGEGEEVGLLPEVWDRDLHRSGGTAVVRFVDRPSAELALKSTRKAAKSGTGIIWGAGIEGRLPPLGSARYLAHHTLRYPDPSMLQSSVDDFMTTFSAQEAELARQREKQRAEPDEDGFITVTRGRRNGPAKIDDTTLKAEELKRRDSNRVKDDFYRFQVREKKKEHAKDLAREFEEDRRRLDEMKRRKGRLRPE